jgi:hypothetical protein
LKVTKVSEHKADILQPSDVLPARRDGLSIQPFGDEHVLVDETSGRVHVLNGTAHQIWIHCDGQTTVSNLINELSASYSNALHDVLLADVSNALAKFHAEKLFADS